MLRPTAISVTVQKDYTLKVIFDNGETKIFDVKPYIKGSWYSQLKDFSYFSLANILLQGGLLNSMQCNDGFQDDW